MSATMDDQRWRTVVTRFIFNAKMSPRFFSATADTDFEQNCQLEPTKLTYVRLN